MHARMHRWIEKGRYITYVHAIHSTMSPHESRRYWRLSQSSSISSPIPISLAAPAHSGNISFPTAADPQDSCVSICDDAVVTAAAFSGGKLSFALAPRNAIAAISYALAASSAVLKVPSHTRTALLGSLISAAHFPHGLSLTPRKVLLHRRRFRFFAGAPPREKKNSQPRHPSMAQILHPSGVSELSPLKTRTSAATIILFSSSSFSLQLKLNCGKEGLCCIVHYFTINR